MKNINLRRIIIGVPTLIIQNGKIIERNKRKQLIDVNDLLEQCRSNGIFDISEIDYALLEVNGKLSILLKSAYKPATCKDLNLKIKKSTLCSNVIIDGKIMIKNIENMNKNVDWLK